MFYFENICGKKILKSDILSKFEPKSPQQKGFWHIFTTKESFIKTKDEKFIDTANSNRTMVLEYLNIKENSLVQIKQTHTTNIAIGHKTPDLIDNTDGIILYKPGSASILNFADCTPVLLYDTENNVTAGLHAGWRGTAGCITRKGVEIMKKEFNSKPEKIIAAIGPCIGQEDFEAGMEVHEELRKTIKCSEDRLFYFKNDKVFPDLARINAQQLTEEGVKTIDICEFKTVKNNDILFSYRKENKTTNRISMVIKLA